jgi:hypothetical protein
MLAVAAGPVSVAADDGARSLPDTLVRVWVPPVAATAGGRVHVGVRVDLEGTDLPLGRVVGRIRFEPRLLAYEGVLPEPEGVDLVVDAGDASGGEVQFSFVREDPAPPVRSTTLVEVRFLVTGPPGGRADVILEIESLDSAPDEDGDRADLLPRAVVRNGIVVIH